MESSARRLGHSESTVNVDGHCCHIIVLSVGNSERILQGPFIRKEVIC